jgi:hypothetical protein
MVNSLQLALPLIVEVAGAVRAVHASGAGARIRESARESNRLGQPNLSTNSPFGIGLWILPLLTLCS